MCVSHQPHEEESIVLGAVCDGGIEQEENDYLDDEWFELSDNTEGLALEDANVDLSEPQKVELLALMK